MNRILDFSSESVSLKIAHRQLEISRNDGTKVTTPVNEIAAVVLSHPSITLTKNVLQELAKSGAVLVVCDEKFLPVGMFAPLIGHHLRGRFMREQAAASTAVQRRAWKEIICAKIKGQAQILKELFGEEYSLPKLMKEVKSGDSTNVEAQAARIYWSKLFGEVNFSRNPENEDAINVSLNYGYAVLRAITARAICAAGLNPALGIFHHNKYDFYCLADDLMEPLRPVVDRIVYRMNSANQLETEVTPEVKRRLIQAINQRFIVNGNQETVFETISRLAVSLVEVFGGRKTELCLPEQLPAMEDQSFAG